MSNRPSWDEYFLEIARVAASRSNCIRAQVGAVVVSKRKKIKSIGYNGTLHGVESCLERGRCYRIENNIESGTRYETCRAIHAEQNAIIQAGEENCVGSTIYIYGHRIVCILCKRFILQAGFEKVILQDKNEKQFHIINPQDWVLEMD